MNDGLDTLLARLRDQAIDRELGSVEDDVQRRLSRRAASAGHGLAPAHAAAIGIALILGTGVGGFTAASALAAPRPSIFAATDALAPSTLLEGHR